VSEGEKCASDVCFVTEDAGVHEGNMRLRVLLTRFSTRAQLVVLATSGARRAFLFASLRR